MRLNSWLQKVGAMVGLLALGLVLSTPVWADIPLYDASGESPDLGDSARNIAGALGGVTELMLGISSITGLGFAAAAIAKYQQHRKNPQQVTISIVVVMVVLAVAFLGLPWLVKVSHATTETAELRDQ